MNSSVHHAIEGLLYGYNEFLGKSGYEKSLTALSQIIIGEGNFDDRAKALDTWIDEHQKYESLREYLFDLLMTQFIRNEGTSEAFFDSPEWDRIEDEYADRGSELLDAITYLDECSEVELIPSIEDFIYEFLLVENNPDKETLALYEPLIRHKALVNEILEDLIDETAHDKENTLGPMLQALLIFFSEPGDAESIPGALNDIGGSSAEAAALSCCMLFYFRGLDGSHLR